MSANELEGRDFARKSLSERFFKTPSRCRAFFLHLPRAFFIMGKLRSAVDKLSAAPALSPHRAGDIGALVRAPHAPGRNAARRGGKQGFFVAEYPVRAPGCWGAAGACRSVRGSSGGWFKEARQLAGGRHPVSIAVSPDAPSTYTLAATDKPGGLKRPRASPAPGTIFAILVIMACCKRRADPRPSRSTRAVRRMAAS